MTSGKIFANGYNEIMMNVFHLQEYNASLGPQHLSNDASFVIFCIKGAGRRPNKMAQMAQIVFLFYITGGIHQIKIMKSWHKLVNIKFDLLNCLQLQYCK